MKKRFLFTTVIIVTMFTAYKMYLTHEETDFSDMLLANIEALADDYEVNNEIKCPDPYDVKNHQLSFTQRQGRFSTDIHGEITIAGRKFTLGGGKANIVVDVTYEIGDCNKRSEGNCCPNKRNGEINIINTVFN